MELTEIYVNPNEIAGEYMAQAFFEWEGQEWEMSIRAASPEEAKAQIESRAATYLEEWAVDSNAANDKYGFKLKE